MRFSLFFPGEKSTTRWDDADEFGSSVPHRDSSSAMAAALTLYGQRHSLNNENDGCCCLDCFCAQTMAVSPLGGRSSESSASPRSSSSAVRSPDGVMRHSILGE